MKKEGAGVASLGDGRGCKLDRRLIPLLWRVALLVSCPDVFGSDVLGLFLVHGGSQPSLLAANGCRQKMASLRSTCPTSLAGH
jgi:hypothetical protein